MRILLQIIICLLPISASLSAFANINKSLDQESNNVANADERFFYIGTTFNVNTPVQKKFNHSSGTRIKLGGSQGYGVTLGYSFYPQMAIEFSAMHQPNYSLNYLLPTNPPMLPVRVAGKTKVVASTYMINMVYDLESHGVLTPFVLFGGGAAFVTVKPTSSSLQGFEIFKIAKTKKVCPTWQIGAGVSAALSNNLSLTMAAKFHVVHNLKFNYSKLDPATRSFGPNAHVKKTIGVAELALGIKYKLPI